MSDETHTEPSTKRSPIDDLRDAIMSRPVLTNREVLALHVAIADLKNAVKQLAEERADFRAVETRVYELELFRERAKVWSSVAGAVWALIVAAVGAGLVFTRG